METNRLNQNGHGATAVDEAPRPSAPDRIATIVNQNQRFRIPGDVIARTCEDLPDEQRQALKWAAGYCRERNLSTEEFGAQLTQPGAENKPYSGDSVYAAFTGRRDAGSLERFTKSIQVLRKRLEETSARHTTFFVETNLSRKIFTACRTALAKQRVTFIFGETQIGKTRALEEYARRHNHGETILVRMPAGGGIGPFLTELAIRLGIGTGNKKTDLRRRIIESFDERTLLVIDECEQCVEGSSPRMAALEFAREIYDRRKCGLVFSGALNFRNSLRTNYALRKLWLRGYRPLQLPSRPGLADLALFAQSFGLDPAEDKDMNVKFPRSDDNGEEVECRVKGNPLQLQEAVIRDYGLGRWLTILEDAADLARERKSRTSWGHVIAAHALITAVEEGGAL